jgi:hypothetical protein
VYVVTAIVALYLNAFVLVVQLFLKVPSLKALAPSQTEWPFGAAQLATLAAFVWLGARAWRGFKPAPAVAGRATKRGRKSKRRRR